VITYSYKGDDTLAEYSQ